MINHFQKSKDIENRIDNLITDITDNFKSDPSMSHIDRYPLPAKKAIIAVLDMLIDILFPGYFTEKEVNSSNLNYYIGNKVNSVYDGLFDIISKSYIHEHQSINRSCDFCQDCLEKSIDATMYLLESLPVIKDTLNKDAEAAFNGDPAARDINEIIYSYPGLYAMTVHRIAHLLYKKEIPLIPRIMSEHSHSLTGIDIHPGATIGNYFFIDHGTGVVIGETAEIGNNVKIYQGVTLGALSFPKDKMGNIIKGLKRHPKIEDNVTIYAGTTILGGETVIGANSTIGGNLWIISSIPADSKVICPDILTRFEIKQNKKKQ